MEAALALGGVAVLAYAATNLDNLLLLVAVATRPAQPYASIVGGVVLATATLLALCGVASLAADFAPERWIGYLGVVPIAMGLRELLGWIRARPGREAVPAGAPVVRAPWVAGLMLANSADSLGVLVPLFAETRDALLPMLAAALLSASLLGCALGYWITTHERIGDLVRRVGPRIVPFVLIGVGLYVLLDTRSDVAPG